MSCTRNNLAHRRYIIRVAVLMAFYLVFLALAVWLIEDGIVAGPLTYVLAALPALPALPVTGVFWAVMRLLVEEKDEYLRLLIVRQTLIATGFALTLVTFWGFLENFDLVPHIDAYWIAILWFAGLGVGGLVNWMTGMMGKEAA